MKIKAVAPPKSSRKKKPKIALALVLIEPDHRDPELYLANTFSYAKRRQLAEHAYQQTRQLLRCRKSGMSAKLARHGIDLDLDVLNDTRRQLAHPLPAPTRVGQALMSLQEVMDDLGDMLARAKKSPHVLAPHA